MKMQRNKSKHGLLEHRTDHDGHNDAYIYIGCTS